MPVFDAHLADLNATTVFQIARLRQDVFVVEQNCPYPDLDALDLQSDTVHLWAEENDQVVGYLRVYPYEDGRKIGRVCTAHDQRGTGLGAKLMEAALKTAGNVPIILDSQTYALGFYAKHGFVAEGEEFLEDDIPHRRMRRLPEG
ncbi:GNAT family N-acetyltransferase [Haloglycomyces albus]|uniref:GNAT family N-acetyltransferase n=1 Tax=Haloglycomyces albus TaxID=526067 RepID=UPI00046CD6B1|nr:GNAT family N-acetyltransferase [Haloglycomyces albus]